MKLAVLIAASALFLGGCSSETAPLEESAACASARNVLSDFENESWDDMETELRRFVDLANADTENPGIRQHARMLRTNWSAFVVAQNSYRPAKAETTGLFPTPAVPAMGKDRLEATWRTFGRGLDRVSDLCE